jgi:hypothetical protein
MLSTFSVVAAAWEPKAEFVVRTPSTLTQVRFWVGLFAAKPDLLNASSTGMRLAAFNFEAGGSGIARWTAVVANGGAASAANFPFNVSPSTTYTLRVDVQASQSKVNFTVDGVLPGVDVNVLPGSLELLGLGIRVTTLSMAARSLSWRRASWRLL